MTDTVHHPEHYTFGGIECIDAINAALGDENRFLAYCEGNVLKYIWRWRTKGGIEDLQKANWYLEKMINTLFANNAFRASHKTYDEWLDFENNTSTATLADFLPEEMKRENPLLYGHGGEDAE